jgi:hypothetical protein
MVAAMFVSIARRKPLIDISISLIFIRNINFLDLDIGHFCEYLNTMIHFNEITATSSE